MRWGYCGEIVVIVIRVNLTIQSFRQCMILCLHQADCAVQICMQNRSSVEQTRDI